MKPMPLILVLITGLLCYDSAPARPVPPLVALAIDCASPPDGDRPNREADRREVWRLDGAVTKLDVGSRTLEVNGVVLWVEHGTVIFVDCRPARLRDLRRGASVAVVYEEREGRNVVMVIEADGEEH
jgi:hypothetical protein